MMKNKIDRPPSKRIYGKRLAVGEPPFAHMQEMGLTKLTLRAPESEWPVAAYMCLHNLKRIHGYGDEKRLKRMAVAQNS